MRFILYSTVDRRKRGDLSRIQVAMIVRMAPVDHR